MVFVAAISCNRTLRGYAGSQCSAFPAPKKEGRHKIRPSRFLKHCALIYSSAAPAAAPCSTGSLSL